MTPINTDRLTIRPLSKEELLEYLKNNSSIPAELSEAIHKDILPNLTGDLEKDLYYSLWTITLKEKLTLIGDLCFKGPPDKDGQIEIGYGLNEKFQKQGYMAEAVQAIVKWAFLQERVKAVISETDKTNIPSHKVLIKNGFVQYKEVGESFWWRRIRRR